MKRALIWIGLVVLVLFAAFVVLNLASLDDGVLYLQDMAAYSEAPARPLDESGRFGFCHQFVTLRNAQRAQFIENFLQARDIPFERLPISRADGTDTGFDNIFVPLAGTGPFTIYSAHYDKFFDEPDYQGASDNSAAVCMLLVAAEELANTPPTRPIAFLFTGEEERGLVGAQSFYDYATANNLQVAEVLNFDSMGRAGIAARALGEKSGFVFTIPLLGEYVYDGRELGPASTYQLSDAALMAQINRVVAVADFDRMVANSDGTYWKTRGWNAVNLSSDDIYYLDETWHTYRDRVELLDQTNFERAVELMVGYAQTAQ